VTALPWWLAGGALGGLAVAYWIADRRPLGVSGVVARFADLPAELRAERDAARASGLADAFAAATAEALDSGELTTPAAPPPPGAVPRPRRTLAPPVPLLDHAAFLVALAAGGLAARAAGATADPLSGLAARAGPGALGVLALGGLLVGFGSAWMGGCTMGHGITGSARGMPGSLVATTVFAGTGVAVSLALAGLVR
jgi:hypothetical protein